MKLAPEIAILIMKRLRNELNDAEKQLLDDWANLHPHNRSLSEKFADDAYLQKVLSSYHQGKTETWEQIQEKIHTPSIVVHRVHFLRRGFYKLCGCHINYF